MEFTVELKILGASKGSVTVGGNTFCSIKIDPKSTHMIFYLEDNEGNQAKLDVNPVSVLNVEKAALFLDGEKMTDIVYTNTLIETFRHSTRSFTVKCLMDDVGIFIEGDSYYGNYVINKEGVPAGEMHLDLPASQRCGFGFIKKAFTASAHMNVTTTLDVTSILPITAGVLMILCHIGDYDGNFMD